MYCTAEVSRYFSRVFSCSIAFKFQGLSLGIQTTLVTSKNTKIIYTS